MKPRVPSDVLKAGDCMKLEDANTRSIQRNLKDTKTYHRANTVLTLALRWATPPMVSRRQETKVRALGVYSRHVLMLMDAKNSQQKCRTKFDFLARVASRRSHLSLQPRPVDRHWWFDTSPHDGQSTLSKLEPEALWKLIKLLRQVGIINRQNSTSIKEALRDQAIFFSIIYLLNMHHFLGRIIRQYSDI